MPRVIDKAANRCQAENIGGGRCNRGTRAGQTLCGQHRTTVADAEICKKPEQNGNAEKIVRETRS
jgi:hypothetical protein